MKISSALVSIPFLLALLISLAAALVDIRSYRIPDILSLVGFLAALVFMLMAGLPLMPRIAAGAGSLALALIARRAGGLGLGDAKLMGFIGFTLGPLEAWIAMITATAAGLAALCLVPPTRRRMHRLPFAPCLFLGVVVSAAWSIA